jgi:hypothetical protein
MKAKLNEGKAQPNDAWMDCLKLIACNSSKNFKFKFINTKYIT